MGQLDKEGAKSRLAENRYHLFDVEKMRVIINEGGEEKRIPS